jgi:hypothetical protein
MNRLWKRLKLSGLIGFVAAVGALTVSAAEELKFPLLKIGTESLTNATVTTRNKDYVFILHSGGMANFKVASLSEESLETLGYKELVKPKAQTNAVVTWAKGTVANLETEQVKALEASLTPYLPTPEKIVKLGPAILAAVAAGFLLSYLFFSYCALLICKKAGTEPGVLVWIPVLQMVPLVKAAGMAPVWVLAFMIPLLNLVAHVVWSFKIAKARGKNAGVAILLLLPLTNILAFIYLAFSESASSSKGEERRAAPIMALEAA